MWILARVLWWMQMHALRCPFPTIRQPRASHDGIPQAQHEFVVSRHATAVIHHDWLSKAGLHTVHLCMLSCGEMLMQISPWPRSCSVEVVINSKPPPHRRHLATKLSGWAGLTHAVPISISGQA